MGFVMVRSGMVRWGVVWQSKLRFLINKTELKILFICSGRFRCDKLLSVMAHYSRIGSVKSRFIFKKEFKNINIMRWVWVWSVDVQ
jgi:hypothetical protein